MVEDLFFQREGVVEVDAAVVGISRLRWESLQREEATEERAQEVMSRKHYDVLPIMDSPEITRAYFCTKRWSDYAEVEQHPIEYQDVIPLRTPLQTVIKSFVKEKRNYYFLANENRIAGLISIANLNCRQVRTYLFGLISELEIRLSELVRREIDDGRLSSEDVLVLMYEKTREQYRSDTKRGVDADLLEYLYFGEFVKLFAQCKLYGLFLYESVDDFKGDFGMLGRLRNQVAHPSKSLIRQPSDVKKLWRLVEIIERSLFHLRQAEANA